MSPHGGRSDVLLIVLDAVRGGEVLSDGGEVAPSLPFLRRFSRDSAVFPRTVAAAPWTLPSVASIMTGQYPWQHGLSAMGQSTLEPGVPTVASGLRSRGYATVLLSANNVVGPRTNLSQGFDRRFVGDWWEMYLRLRRSTPSERGDAMAADSREGSASVRRYSRRTLMRRGVRMVFRFPELAERASLLAQKLKNPESPPGTSVSPWIEPTLRAVLRDVPKDQPLFCAMHLNDAHEPYYREPPPRLFPIAGTPSMVRQDFMHQIEGTWVPDAGELAALRQLYRGMIRSLDRRLETMISDFSRERDLERTLVLITADHGQAFGEEGWLFHMNSTDDGLLRVPLIARLPGLLPGGSARGWASLVDLAPTVFEAAGVPATGDYRGRLLSDLMSQDRPDPVWALSDGLPARHLDGIVNPRVLRQETSQRHRIVAYEGSSKWTYDLASRRLAEASATAASLDGVAASDQERERARARILADAEQYSDLLVRHGSSSVSAEVSDRLESWGYGV